MSVQIARPLPPAIVPVLLMTISNGPFELIAWLDVEMIEPLFVIVVAPLEMEIALSPPVIVPALLNVRRRSR